LGCPEEAGDGHGYPVAAKESAEAAALKPVSRPKTSLTGNVPKKPVAVPAKV
jgi:hypothetical protein